MPSLAEARAAVLGTIRRQGQEGQPGVPGLPRGFQPRGQPPPPPPAPDGDGRAPLADIGAELGIDLSGLFDQGPSSEDVTAAATRVQRALAAGQQPNVADIILLDEAGVLTASGTSDFLFGDDTGDGGGGGTGIATAQIRAAVDREKLAETKAQNQWDRMIDKITAQRDAATAEASSQTARLNAMLDAGPSLAGGREFFGGFGPEGGFTALASMLDLDVGPLSTEQSIQPISLPDLLEPQGDEIESLLGPMV